MFSLNIINYSTSQRSNTLREFVSHGSSLNARADTCCFRVVVCHSHTGVLPQKPCGSFPNTRTGVVNTRKANTRVQSMSTSTSHIHAPVWRELTPASQTPVSNTRITDSRKRTTNSRITDSRGKPCQTPVRCEKTPVSGQLVNSRVKNKSRFSLLLYSFFWKDTF